MSRVTVTISGEEANLLRAIDKVILKQAQLGAAAGAVGRKSQEASALSELGLGKMASAAGLTAAAIGGVTAALSAMHEERARGAAAARDATSGFGRLAQLAGTQGEFDDLVSRSVDLAAAGGFESQDAATGVIFDLTSAGALGETDFFSDFNRVGDAGGLASSAATLRNNLGADETGSLQALVSKALAGASDVTGVGAGDILRGSAASAQAAGKLGISDEELIAATSQLATKTSSGDTAGTQLSALLSAFNKKGLIKEGQSIESAVSGLSAQNLDPKALNKLLGRQEAVKAFTALSGFDLSGRAEFIGEGQEDDLAGQKISFVRGNEITGAGDAAKSSAARRAAINLRAASSANFNLGVSRRDEIVSANQAAGGSAFSRLGFDAGANAAIALGGGETAAEVGAGVGAGLVRGIARNAAGGVLGGAINPLGGLLLDLPDAIDEISNLLRGGGSAPGDSERER